MKLGPGTDWHTFVVLRKKKEVQTYMVESRAWRAAGKNKPRMIFHRYFLDLRFSALHSGHASGDGSGRCPHVLRTLAASPFRPRREVMYEMLIPCPWLSLRLQVKSKISKKMKRNARTTVYL